jgi:hypothetical protein
MLKHVVLIVRSLVVEKQILKHVVLIVQSLVALNNRNSNIIRSSLRNREEDFFMLQRTD